MCLKGNFSPMVASMHGNEALKTPCHKKSEITTLECLHGDFRMASRVHPPALKVPNMFPISNLKRLSFSTSPIPGLEYLPNTSPISGLKYISILCDSLCQQVSMPHYEQPAAFPKANPKVSQGPFNYAFQNKPCYASMRHPKPGHKT